ncbi:recombinase family protein [Sulfobacillus thermosulfidooxidans]|uniref:recombinase family protein n=1 Tax=Sulfobacillus thermosulfidooxidans TaxID=28034 RepID=UPI0006B4674A|nr:recombinase family protein [Sulfobacillus thermosulfidooxidans]
MKTTNSRIRRRMQARKEAAARHTETAKVAVGYVRVSTEEQRDGGLSLGAQREAIEAFAKSQGYHLLDIIEDAAVSGAKDPASRPGFGHVLELAQAGAFGILLVWKFDRLARHLAYAVTTAQTLREQYAVTLRSVTEPIETESPVGQMMFGIFASMAAMEREEIKERTLMGRKAKAQQGGFAGGKAPYGYRRDKEGGLVLVPDEAAIVRQIFALHKQGLGTKAIAHRLNADGVPTRSGKPWIFTTIKGILENAKYEGLVEYYFADEGLHVRQPGQHEAILPPKASKRAG